MKKRALISVSDKAGVIDFAKNLVSLGYEIISTGGTKDALDKAGVTTIGISDITGFPECLDGRVKTLHPAVHAGLLAMRANKTHMQSLADLGINTIDIVAVNLYPFKNTIEKPNVAQAEAVENIDIGGPTMLRSAAKNYQDVAVIVDPADYDVVVNEIKNQTDVSRETKFRLMYKVFAHTAGYDALIADYLAKQQGIVLPEQISFAYEKQQDLRYGENPHQQAIFYKEPLAVAGSLTQAVQLHGKELSFNNINDANGALELLYEFGQKTPTVVAVKHANPCGVASAKTVCEAYKKAHDADPVSVFGGIIATNGTVCADTAKEIAKIFIEIVIAPDFTKEAIEILSQKQAIRLLKLDMANLKHDGFEFKKVRGGLLVQGVNPPREEEIKVVTKLAPTKEQIEDLRFAMKVVKHAKSNAIVTAKAGQTLGLGMGMTNRIWATEQALTRVVGDVSGAVLASDAFFPFSDVVDAAAKAGIKAIIQPGGSVRDQDSIDACDKYGIAMVFSGVRHFKH